jgi:lambda family phage minor tail protein L
MSTVKSELQKLNPDGIIELFQLDATSIGANSLYFHGDTTMGTIVWQGQEYDPWPIEAVDFARTSDQQPMPKLTVANLDGSITRLCQVYDDMVGTVVKRIRTFVKFLDAVNFPDGNPEADPNEQFPPEIWYIERKSGETQDNVSFELVSAFDLGGVQLPRRQIIANYCTWKSVGGYRGEYCGYTGPAVAKEDGTPTTNPGEDRCGGKLSDCRLRKWPEDVMNFGGFPAAGLMRT